MSMMSWQKMRSFLPRMRESSALAAMSLEMTEAQFHSSSRRLWRWQMDCGFFLEPQLWRWWSSLRPFGAADFCAIQGPNNWCKAEVETFRCERFWKHFGLALDIWQEAGWIVMFIVKELAAYMSKPTLGPLQRFRKFTGNLGVKLAM